MLKKNSNETKSTSHSKYRCQYHIAGVTQGGGYVVLVPCVMKEYCNFYKML